MSERTGLEARYPGTRGITCCAKPCQPSARLRPEDGRPGLPPPDRTGQQA